MVKMAHMPCRPGSRHTVDRPLAPQGRWGDKQDSEGGDGEGGLDSEKQGKQVHGRMDDICYATF